MIGFIGLVCVALLILVQPYLVYVAYARENKEQKSFGITDFIMHSRMKNVYWLCLSLPAIMAYLEFDMARFLIPYIQDQMIRVIVFFIATYGLSVMYDRLVGMYIKLKHWYIVPMLSLLCYASAFRVDSAESKLALAVFVYAMVLVHAKYVGKQRADK